MSRFNLTYQRVRERHPTELEQLKAQVAASNMKGKTVPVEQWQFFYSTSTRIEGMTGTQFMEKMRSGDLDREEEARHNWDQTATLEDRVTDHKERTEVRLIAKPAARGGGVHVDISSIPPEVQNDIVETEHREMESIARLNAMTPEEREADTQRILRELRGSPGFAEIHVGEDGQARALLGGLELGLRQGEHIQMKRSGPTQTEPQKEKPKKRDKWSGGAIRV